MKDLYICCQMIVKETKFINGCSTTIMENIIRQIIADSKEEAVGKFILNTQDVTAEKRLNLECIKLTDLKSIS